MAETKTASDDLSTRLAVDDIFVWLLGEKPDPVDDVWFGDEEEAGRAPFWWRTKLRSLRDALSAPTDAARGLAVTEENRELRQIISQCAEKLGNGAFVGPECSLDFMRHLPNEMALHVAALRTSPPETVGGGKALVDRLRFEAEPFGDKRNYVEELFATAADALEAALSSAPPAEETWQAPDGFRLVPIVATDEMRDAAVKGSRADVSYYDVDELWPAMLAAAPLPPGPAGEAK